MKCINKINILKNYGGKLGENILPRVVQFGVLK